MRARVRACESERDRSAKNNTHALAHTLSQSLTLRHMLTHSHTATDSRVFSLLSLCLPLSILRFISLFQACCRCRSRRLARIQGHNRLHSQDSIKRRSFPQNRCIPRVRGVLHRHYGLPRRLFRPLRHASTPRPDAQRWLLGQAQPGLWCNGGGWPRILPSGMCLRMYFVSFLPFCL